MILNCTHREKECIPVGCVPSAAVAVCWGVSAPGGGSVPGEGVLWGVSAPGGMSATGGCIPACTGADL